MSVLPPHVAEALRKGNKIEAIKLLREATKLGLAEAKGVIDRHDGTHPKAAPANASIGLPRHAGAPVHRAGLSPGEEPRTSFSGVAIAIALAVAALAAWIYWPG